MKNKKASSIIFTIITFVFLILELVLLPDMVTIQISFNGSYANYISKYVASLLSFVISFSGIIQLFFLKQIDGKKKIKNLLLILSGYILSIFVLIVNL